MFANEEEFLAHLRGVQGYIIGLKVGEPGYIFDNEKEYNDLLAEYNRLNCQNPETKQIMMFIGNEIDLHNKRKNQPPRNPQEEQFYRHIVGVNSYIRETKQREPKYVFNAIGEVETLLNRLRELNTQDHDILAIMDIITRDIKLTIFSIYGQEKADEYQEKLTILNIGMTFNQR
jgi:hypothetical protein